MFIIVKRKVWEQVVESIKRPNDERGYLCNRLDSVEETLDCMVPMKKDIARMQTNIKWIVRFLWVLIPILLGEIIVGLISSIAGG